MSASSVINIQLKQTLGPINCVARMHHGILWYDILLNQPLACDANIQAWDITWCYQSSRTTSMHTHQGPVSISENTSFRKISLSLEAARFVFRIVRSLWNLTGTSTAVLPMCLSNFKAIRQFKVPISWLRDFTRSYEKTSFRILRRGPGVYALRH